MKYHFLLLLLIPYLYSCNEGDPKKDPKDPTKDSTLPKPTVTNVTACVFSAISYSNSPDSQVEKHLPGWRIVWNPSSVGGNYAFLATNGTDYALAFRGSLVTFTEDAFNNWIYNDLNVATQISWSYCSDPKASVSQGSYIGWQNLEKMKDKATGKTLWAYLSENVPAEKSITLTGHSLGGNLASVYASYLWWKFNESGHPKKNINVITFGAPAAGNASFAYDFDSKFQYSERIENKNDIVPKFPCSNKLGQLADLYSPTCSASSISIGYKNVATKLSTVFVLVSQALDLLKLTGKFSGYMHTNGDGNILNIALSGKNNTNAPAAWFAEAGHQHSMAQYAIGIGAPLVSEQ